MLARVGLVSNCPVNAGRAVLAGPMKLAEPARGQLGFKSSCECGPSWAEGRACPLSIKMAWSEHETGCLIDLWGEESVQFQIEG